MRKPVTKKIDKWLHDWRQKRLLEYNANAVGAMGRRGWPDREVLAMSMVWFIEIKEDGDTLSPSQQDRIERLQEQYHHVLIAENHNVDGIITSISNKILELREQVESLSKSEAIVPENMRLN